MRKILTTIFIALFIGYTSSLVSYAYFVNQVQINNDLKIRTGTFGVNIGEGINSSLMPGQSSEYNYFDITNTGTLNNKINITFKNVNKDSSYIEKNILYELQIKQSDGEYSTVLNTDLLTLNTTTLNYVINANDSISFRTKITISEDVDSQQYNQHINLRLNINAHQTNSTY